MIEILHFDSLILGSSIESNIFLVAKLQKSSTTLEVVCFLL
jgi:hypothetical protein